MADYAFGILVVTAAQLVFSVLTLLALGWANFESRRTAKASVKMAAALPRLERAYVFERIETGSGQRPVFYAKVVYDDIFGEEHITQFYWQYNGEQKMFAPLRVADYNKRT